MTHQCPARGCRRQVPDKLLMCPADWRLLPRSIQRAVNVAYYGAGVGTPELLAAHQVAIEYVNRERTDNA